MQEIIEESVKKDSRKNSSSGIQIKEFLMACLRNWYWFVISLIVCGSLAYLYSKAQIQQYRSSAMILVTTNTSKSTGSQSQVFSDLGITPASSFIPNEIYKITSTELMEEVVNQLGLNIQYYGHVYLRDVNSYKTSPLQITPLREITTPFTMTVVPKGGNDLEYKVNDEGWQKAKFGNKVNTKFGPIAITKTQRYSEQYKDFKVIVRVNTIHDAAVSYKSRLVAESPEKYSDVLRLTMTCDNPKLATDILNALIAVYIQDAINDKNRVARSTEAFISDRIVSIAEDLSGVDSQVAQLKVGSVNATMFSDPSTGVRMAENANNASMQYSLANEILQYVSRMNGNELIPSNTGIANTGIESQISQYNEAMLKYQKIAATSSSENPVMIELTNSLASMKSAIINSLSNYLNSLRLQVSNARSQEGRATSSMTAVPSHEKALTQVTRQQQIKEQLYLYLLNKREENALQLAITEPNAKVIEKAVSNGQIAPVPSKIMSMGLILGLLLPALILFIYYWIKSLDTMVHTRSDVERSCSLPIIGDLPEKRNDQKDKEIVVTENGNDRITEALRIVRNNLDYVVHERNGEGIVLQMTSTMAGEGKSFVAINMALTFAYAEKRVIAIDLDLRKGRFTEYMKLENNGRGVSSYLSGKEDNIDNLLVKGYISENLDVMCVGAIPPNPTNLLMSKRFKELIEQLRKRYDYIVLDTVPYGLIADASIINRHVDLTIYVMRDGKIDSRFLPDLERMSDEGKIKNLSILLNDMKSNNKHYGYSYGYGYGYGYGYNDESDGKIKSIFKSIKPKKS